MTCACTPHTSRQMVTASPGDSSQRWRRSRKLAIVSIRIRDGVFCIQHQRALCDTVRAELGAFKTVLNIRFVPDSPGSQLKDLARSTSLAHAGPQNPGPLAGARGRTRTPPKA